MSEPDHLRSVEVFARNVTGSQALAHRLMDVARAELGQDTPEMAIDDRASELLLQALCSVGVDPKTERSQREGLARLLSGSSLSSDEVQRSVEYVLSQMVVQPKGALAECLAIAPSIGHLRALKAAGAVPAIAVFKRGVWSRRILNGETGEGARFSEWREGADGLFCAVVTSDARIRLAERSTSNQHPEVGDLLVFGVSEVKCYRHVSRRALGEQLNKHLARLAGGLQLRDWRGRTIESEYTPHRLWYATGDADAIRVLPATDLPFRLVVRPGRNGRRATVIWTHPMMDELVRLSVGPRKSGQDRVARARVPVFDALLPLDEEELEELAVAMADYALGAMADQPDIDLSGAEWSWNVARALEFIESDGLFSRQLARREKLLRHLE